MTAERKGSGMIDGRDQEVVQLVLQVAAGRRRRYGGRLIKRDAK